MIPSSVREGASCEFSMIVRMHQAKIGCIHIMYLHQKLCTMSSLGAFQFNALFKTLDISKTVAIAVSISGIPYSRCFSSLNHVVYKLLLFILLQIAD